MLPSQVPTPEGIVPSAVPHLPRGGEHQNIARLVAVLDVLAASGDQGLRLVDVCAQTGLGKTSGHRLLNGLTAFQLATFDRDSGHYFLGDRLHVWALRSSSQFELSRRVVPYLEALEAEFQDTVYFLQRRDDDVHCLARIEGSYPIKTLTLDVGDVRPIGAGSAGLAVAAALDDREIEELTRRRHEELARFGVTGPGLADDVALTRANGHSVIENRLIPGMTGLGVAVLSPGGRPVAAISVVAINSRMDPGRRAGIALELRLTVDRIQTDLSPLLR